MGLFDKFKKDSAPKPVVEVKQDSPEGSFMNQLSEIQTHMIKLCNDYAKGRADRIFIHGYMSDSVVGAKDLYEVNGKLVRPHKLGEVIKGVEGSSPLRELTHDFVEIRDVLKEANQKIPFEIKMVYDARNGSLDAKWNYPPLPKGVKKDIAVSALCELWFEEMGDENKTMLNLLRPDELGPAGPGTTTPSPVSAPVAPASAVASDEAVAEAPDPGDPLRYEAFAKHVDEALEGDFPDGVVAVCFNLYDDLLYNWAIEIVGTSAFDKDDSDWACEEVTDFSTRSTPLKWKEKVEGLEIQAEAVDLVKKYLKSGKHADKLKALQGVGVGFVDGDLELL